MAGMVWNWKFDGEDWQHATITGVSSTNGVRLVGTNQNGIWAYWGRYGLIWSTFDFSNWRIYELDTLGLSEEGRIYQLITSPGKFVAATDEGIIQFDGENWEKYTPPQTDISSVFRVAALPEGQLWIATQSFSNPVSTTVLTGVLIVLVLAGFAILFTLIWLRRVQLRHSIEARQHLQEWMPEIIQPKSIRLTQAVYLLWTVVLFGSGIAIAQLPRLGTTGYILFGIALVICVIVTLIIWRKQLGQAVSVKRVILYALPVISLFLWFGFLAIGIVILFDQDSSLNILFFIFWVAALVIVYLFPYYFAYRIPLARGDYATAVKRIEQLRRLQPDRFNYIFYHGAILLVAQRYAESEAVFRDCVIRMRNTQPLMQSVILNGLGEAMIGQGRYTEASRAIELSAYMFPKLRTAYCSLAELYLEHGDNPERALELTEFAQKHGPLNFLTNLIEPFHTSINWGIQAWALAKLNRSNEANQAIATAFQKMKSNFKPALSALHYFSGQVKATQDDQTGAREQFKQSIETDPSGIYALRAQKSLTGDNPVS